MTILIIVPMFENASLTERLLSSLDSNADELVRNHASVVAINDSPWDLQLSDVIETHIAINREYDFRVVLNSENIGFIKSANIGLKECLRSGRDPLLLNSDTVVFPGWLDEMAWVKNSDPMIAFVSPRSNNATICTYPHSAVERTLSPADFAKLHSETSARLNRKTYTPTAVGFCILINHSVIEEFGVFDPAYGEGYNEENDLIMRANEYGYRSALANRAFVWHQGEASFNKTRSSRNTRETNNSKILNKRYPHYTTSVVEYYKSPEYNSEKIIACLGKFEERPSITFDLSSVGPYHNGSFEAAIQILQAAGSNWAGYRVVAYASQAARDFHELEQLEGVTWVDSSEKFPLSFASVRIGQPFEYDVISTLFHGSAVVVVMMLDTIAMDVLRLRREFDVSVWHATLELVDAVVYNSRFTMHQFRQRFDRRPRIELVSHHSLSLDQYGSEKPPVGQYILVVGNQFPHKDVARTAIFLAEALPDRSIVALGSPGTSHGNLRYVMSGSLNAHEIDQLYAECEVAVFPSHYEGFGFPVLHALARAKPVYVRRLPPTVEIVEALGEAAANVKWFVTAKTLAEELRVAPRSWKATHYRGEVDGWGRSSAEILDAIERGAADLNQERIIHRLRWLEIVARRRRDTADRVAERLVMWVSSIVRVSLRIPPVRIVGRWLWRRLGPR